MHIQSKLIEVSKVICDLKLSDEYRVDDSIEQEILIDNGGNHVDINSRVLFTSGLCIIETSLEIAKKVTDYFYVHGEHIKHTFFVNGRSHVSESDGDRSFDLDIGVMRRNFLNGSLWDVEMRGNNSVRYFAILLSKDFFINLVGQEQWSANDDFVQHVANNDAAMNVDETYPINLPILRLLRDILDVDHIITDKRYYVELKLRELFFLIHEQQVLSNRLLASNPHLYKTLENVKAYLIMNFHNPPTIKKLARLFLLNEKKLMHDFKNAFGITIYAFIIQLRMDKAQKMLFDNYSVNAMATELGYRSVSHFIKTFKSFYGHTPKEALMRISRSIA
ncbi:helix-turn-helix transcriptional regulator [Olivibacter sitiensis]|uniref:helix-turn-helix transcriptional regulator n=1 Tax=Olivibacter sitiensis TaxID=376470 RepID=UPI00041B844D|nr:AraC family transcriptional regulator [Olivibacter sitiensis]